ncbi:MAG TPA: cation:proton antiporter [Gemmatimonadales bacterium]|nr:cation:proton antiporter [Gemmatimonadales bacterium]
MTQAVQLHDVLIMLVAAVAVVSVFRRFQASAALGYLVAGALIGPSGLALLDNADATSVLAQFGVVFLLFSVGLELSIERLTSLRRFVFGLGAMQMAVTSGVFCLGLIALGQKPAAALILSTGLALSSTAIVLHTLVERREILSTQGRVSLAVLLFQDLAVVPLLTLVPLLMPSDTGLLKALAGALVKATAAIVLILTIGRLLVRPALRAVARGKTSELFTGVVLLLVLGLGWLTEQAGLSMALGAFLAGLLIAETEYRPQVEGDIQPFRGLLLALFFMTVGMGLDLGLLRDRWLLLATLLLGLLIAKAGILVGLAALFRLPLSVSVRLGISLAQGGEFAFVLFLLARDAGVLPRAVTGIAMLVTGLSMAVTPLLLGVARTLSRRLDAAPSGRHGVSLDDISQLQDHVVIAGFGRVGQTLGLLLESVDAPYLALDLDSEHVDLARRQGIPVFFGDASRADVLKAAAVERAQVVVVTLDEPESASRTVQVLRNMMPDIPILARARDVGQCAKLVWAGATCVVPEVVEGSLQLGGELLRSLGGSPEETNEVLEQFRKQSYSRLTELTLQVPSSPGSTRVPG